jgi:uncharacterized protein (DUF952 family)
MSSLIFKIVAKQAWAEAVASGCFMGAAIDLADGFIHLSNAAQAEETAARYFAGQTDLLLVAYDTGSFGTALKWEVSRGGALFPHVYGTLDPSQALWAKPLVWNGTSHVFPVGWKE